MLDDKQFDGSLSAAFEGDKNMKLNLKMFKKLFLILVLLVLAGCIQQSDVECQVESDCKLTWIEYSEFSGCPACDQTDPRWQCLKASEAQKIIDEAENQGFIKPCEPCLPEEVKNVKCQCLNNKCQKVNE